MTTIQSQSQVRAEDTTQSLSQNPVQNLDQDRSQDLDQDQGLGNAVEIHHLTCTTGRIQIISEGSTIQRTKLTTIGVTSPSITIIDMSIGQLGHLQDQDNFEEKVLLQVLKNWITNA